MFKHGSSLIDSPNSAIEALIKPRWIATIVYDGDSPLSTLARGLGAAKHGSSLIDRHHRKTKDRICCAVGVRPMEKKKLMFHEETPPHQSRSSQGGDWVYSFLHTSVPNVTKVPMIHREYHVEIKFRWKQHAKLCFKFQRSLKYSSDVLLACESLSTNTNMFTR